MPGQRRSDSFFGGASMFSGSQLPSHQDCGQAWKSCRLELQAQSPGKKITNHEVAKDVISVNVLLS